MPYGIDDDDVMRRAYAAYYRRVGPIGDIPGGSESGIEWHGGKAYAVLRNIRGVLAVYRVRNDGKLKALRRPPAALKE